MLTVPDKRKKKNLWTGTAQVLIDDHGYSRAVLIHEYQNVYRLIGPIGCASTATNDMALKDREGTELKMKRLIEKELRDAGYY